MKDRTPTFHTDRLILKAITLADTNNYTNHFVDYEVIRYLSASTPWPYPDGGVKDYLVTEIISKQGKERWDWGIFLKDNPSELIGGIGLWREGSPEHRGFWLGKKFWKKGIMTEAVIPVMDFAFYELGLEHLIFSNALGNTASRRIKEKTGCTLIDIRPANFNDPVYTHQEIWKLSIEAWEKHKDLTK